MVVRRRSASGVDDADRTCCASCVGRRGVGDSESPWLPCAGRCVIAQPPIHDVGGLEGFRARTDFWIAVGFVP